MTLYHNPAGLTLRSAIADATIGTAISGGALVKNYGLAVQINHGGQSAIVDYQASPDGVNWGTVLTLTALNSATVILPFSAFYPFFRANTRLVYSGSNHTGIVSVVYQPGMGG